MARPNEDYRNILNLVHQMFPDDQFVMVIWRPKEGVADLIGSDGGKAPTGESLQMLTLASKAIGQAQDAIRETLS